MILRIDKLIISILQMKKLKPKEIKHKSYYTADKWKTRNQPMPLTNILFHFNF